MKNIAFAAGVLYPLTFVSKPIGFLYRSVLNDPNYIFSSRLDTPTIIGGILALIVAFAGFGTAVVPYPAPKRQNEAAALSVWYLAKTFKPLLILLNSNFVKGQGFISLT